MRTRGPFRRRRAFRPAAPDFRRARRRAREAQAEIRRIAMRSIVALLVSCSLFCATLAPATAAADKTLQNLKGDVSFQAPGGAKTAIGAKASIALSDAYSAI